MNYNFLKNLNKKQYLVLLLVISLYFFLLLSNLVHYVVWTTFSNGEHLLFFDWQTMLYFNECHSLGIDVYNIKSCDQKIFPYPIIWGYGPSFLWLSFPYFENLNFFYLKLLPIFFIILFVFSIIKLINPTCKIGFLLTFLVLINPGTIQLVEKFNFDLIVFLITILIITSNKKILNSILILVIASIKFYPIVLIYNFLLSKEKFYQNITFIILTLLIFILYFYLNIDDISKIFNSEMLKDLPAGAKNFYVFSINDYLIDRKDIIQNLLKFINLNFIYKIIEFKIINLIALTALSSLFIYVLLKKKISNDNIFKIEHKLFMIGSTILISAYLLHPNLYYREIFLALLIPLLINLHREYKGIFTYLVYFLVLKYFLNFLIIISDNNLFNSYIITGSINIILPLFDFVFISFNLALYLIFNYVLIQNYKKKTN